MGALFGFLGAAGVAGLAVYLIGRAATGTTPSSTGARVDYEFPPEVVTHSPEYLAREKAAKVAASKAAPIQGGPRMTQRQQRITDLLGLVKAEKDATKKLALAEELKKLALEEKAALVAPPAVPQPLYPVGLKISFGKRKATITAAYQDAQGVWQYTAYVESGEVFGLGTKSYNFDEASLRANLQKEVGPIQPGQAFVPNVTVYRNGQGGLIQRAEKNASGVWIYSLSGWPNPVSQDELGAILRRA
jgi:hypothetical protein